MFNLDLKRAEMAIEGGRLDEAIRLLQSSAAVKHSNGQRLRDRLITELLNRAQLHLDHGRLEAARRDAGLAKQLGGQQVAVLELLEKIENKYDSQAGHVQDAATANLLDRLNGLISANDHEQTILWLVSQPASFRQRPETLALIAKPIAQLKQQATADFDSGRLDRCAAKVDLLQRTGDQSHHGTELTEQLERCRSIDQSIQQANFKIALRNIQHVQRVSPKTSWAKSMITAIKQCQTGIETLHAGPLGLLPARSIETFDSLGLAAVERPRKNRPMAKPAKITPELTGNSTCQQSLLQVDQLGGVMLLRGNSISIGTPGIASNSTIVLQTEGLTSQIQISRDGEDYFVSSTGGLRVNNVLADRHILTSGDVITVGARGRLKFLRPVAASNSAVLIVQGAKLKRRDIRGIVLVDDAVVFGDSGCHFSVPNLPRRVILRPSDHAQEFLIHEKGSSCKYRLTYDESKTIAGVGFTLSPIAKPVSSSFNGKQIS